MGRKRGEAVMAMEVSVLIFLITLAIVGYIILLPAEDREELLGTSDTSGSDGTSGSSGTEVLLSEAPGEVSSSRSTSQTRSLEPIRLYSTTESATEDLSTSLTVSRNILQNNYKTITFDMDDLENLESLGLLFLITESKGDLIVELNGNIVYEGALRTSDLPLTLPTNALEEEDNVLKLSTDLSYNPFSAHYYLLQDVQLVEDFTVSSTSSTRSFSVDDPGSVTKAELTYFITCNDDADGILTISLNSREVFSDQIFCEYLNERELSLSSSYIGSSNALTFAITEGDYNVEEADVVITTKAEDYPSFSFDVDSDVYESISAGEKEVYLLLSFSDDTSEKQADVLVQEFSFSFDTESDSYEKKITAYIDNGANSITIEPDNSFEIDNLKVYVTDA
jgi:hypothetical protein